MRNHVVAINYGDTFFLRGTYLVKPKFPDTPGLEAAGVIAAVAPDVKGLKIGMLVAYIGMGAYAEYTLIRASRVMAIPDEMNFEQAASLPTAVLTAWHMLHSCHNTKPGESVIVHAAAGGVGIATVQIAKAAGARVIGTRTNLRRSNDIAQMATIVRDGIKAGALRVSTCAYSGASHAREGLGSRDLRGRRRNAGHRSRTGGGRARRLRDHHGRHRTDADLQWLADLTIETGRPITLAALISGLRNEDGRGAGTHSTDQCQRRSDGVADCAAAAASLMRLQSSLDPFSSHRSYRQLMAGLSFDERVDRMRDQNVRAQLPNDGPAVKEELTLAMVNRFDLHFALGDPPDYEPSAEMSIAARARRKGKRPEEIAYDALLENDGRDIIYTPLAFKDYSFDSPRPLLNPATVMSLSVGRAYCGVICDAGMPTYLLTHWVRDRRRGERILLEAAVKRQTRDTAELYGMADRGVQAPGMIPTDASRGAITFPTFLTQDQAA